MKSDILIHSTLSISRPDYDNEETYQRPTTPPLSVEDVETTTCFLAGLSTLSECSDFTQSVDAEYEPYDFDPEHYGMRTPCVSESDDFDYVNHMAPWEDTLQDSRSLSAAEFAQPAEVMLDTRASRNVLQECLDREQEPVHGYLETLQQQHGLTAVMRAETLAWLAELIKFHDCDHSVFCYAAQLFDTLLSKAKMQPRFLKVAAVTCFVLASKTLLEECDQPLLLDLCANCDHQFHVPDIKRFEYVILNKLGWQLPTRSPLTLLEDMLAIVSSTVHLSPSRLAAIITPLSAKFASLAYSYELQRNKQSLLAAALIALELPHLSDANSDDVTCALTALLAVGERDLMNTSRFIARHLRVVASLFV